MQSSTAAASAGPAIPRSHAYRDNGAYTLTVSVVDDDGGVGSDTAGMYVVSAAPVGNVGTDHLGGIEGRAHTHVHSFSDLGAGDSHRITIDWGDGSAGEMQ